MLLGLKGELKFFPLVSGTALCVSAFKQRSSSRLPWTGLESPDSVVLPSPPAEQGLIPNPLKSVETFFLVALGQRPEGLWTAFPRLHLGQPLTQA